MATRRLPPSHRALIAAGRCAHLADRGKCGEKGSREYCPISCEVCRLCDGHPMLKLFKKVLARRVKRPSYYGTVAGTMEGVQSSSAVIDDSMAPAAKPTSSTVSFTAPSAATAASIGLSARAEEGHAPPDAHAENLLSKGVDLLRNLLRGESQEQQHRRQHQQRSSAQPAARIDMPTCDRCVADGGASGAFELQQYERFAKRDEDGGASTITDIAGLRSLVEGDSLSHRDGGGASKRGSSRRVSSRDGGGSHYLVSEVVASGGCLHLTIVQTSPAPSGGVGGHLLAGGASFRAVVDGGAIEICCVRDHFDGSYSVTCPRRALDADGCGQIAIQLGFEQYDAYANHQKGDAACSTINCRSSGGFRQPLYKPLLTRCYCEAPAAWRAWVADTTTFDEWHGTETHRYGAAKSKAVSLASAARRRHVRGLRPSPIYSCSSIGVWTRTHQPGMFLPSPGGAAHEWWESSWKWQSACSPSALARLQVSSLLSSDPPSSPGAAPAAPAGGSDGYGSDDGAAVTSTRAPNHANGLFDGSDFLFAPSRLRSVHFIGESHLALMVDCFAASHEEAGHLEPSPWQSMHRMEPHPPAQPYDGMLAAHFRGPHAEAELHEWATCAGRPSGCWSVWNASLNGYNEQGQSGIQTFKRRCWKWKQGAGGSTPLVCKHEETGACVRVGYAWTNAPTSCCL